MKYYLRKIGSQTVRGPYTKEEIDENLPDELERGLMEALPDLGKGAESIPGSVGWLPVGRLFRARPEEAPPETYYATERFWITVVSRIAIWLLVISAAVMLVSELSGRSILPAIWQTLCVTTSGLLVIFGIKFGVLILADIADVQRRREDQE